MSELLNQIEQLSSYIKASGNTVFFGGAGVSTESGIPDFRSEDGLFKAQKAYGYPPENLLSRTFFDREQELFFRYYRENLISLDVRPNAAHIALAELERAGKLKIIITQNVEGLHQAAGSVNVIELHGSNHRQLCMKCGEVYPLEYILKQDIIPKCEKCGGAVRPDIVLYEEQLDRAVINKAIRAIAAAELMIVGGTSLSVYPAAGLLQYFTGDTLVLINKSETQADKNAQLVIRESIGKVLSMVKV